MYFFSSPLPRTLGLVIQSENFNYNHYTNYIMDSWSYVENPVPEQKPRLHPGDDLAALTMLYEQCKVKTSVPVAEQSELQQESKLD